VHELGTDDIIDYTAGRLPGPGSVLVEPPIVRHGKQIAAREGHQ
jgi:hypothetical protein